MKGIILAGGLGTRLHPLTAVTNKCLLPVYDRPMIYYPIELLVKSGVRDILLVCGGNAAGEFLRILGNGEQFGLKHLHYTYQSEPRGIADALGLAEEFVGEDKMAVALADNIFQDDMSAVFKSFNETDDVPCALFGTRVTNPQHYGVIVEGPGSNDYYAVVERIVEKPKESLGNLIATGLYLYDNTVWDFIKQLTPSARGELEITDVNNHYIKKGYVQCHKLSGWWADAGENFDTYLDSCIKVRDFVKQQRKR